jgi:hypothetical protein
MVTESDYTSLRSRRFESCRYYLSTFFVILLLYLKVLSSLIMMLFNGPLLGQLLPVPTVVLSCQRVRNLGLSARLSCSILSRRGT